MYPRTRACSAVPGGCGAFASISMCFWARAALYSSGDAIDVSGAGPQKTARPTSIALIAKTSVIRNATSGGGKMPSPDFAFVGLAARRGSSPVDFRFAIKSLFPQNTAFDSMSSPKTSDISIEYTKERPILRDNLPLRAQHDAKHGTSILQLTNNARIAHATYVDFVSKFSPSPRLLACRFHSKSIGATESAC